MDETFTSTEWKGGRALTYGIMKSVQDQGSSLMVISSHYRGLREATYGWPIVQFSHFPIDAMFKDDEWKIEFPHRKRPGPLRDPRYALKVARENAPGGYEKRFFDQTILDYAEQRRNKRKLHSLVFLYHPPRPGGGRQECGSRKANMAFFASFRIQ